MDVLKEAAIVYNNLLNVKYKIILGKKGKLTEFEIMFEKIHFHHLIGLQYLTDLPQMKRKRDVIFDEIINGQITVETIQKSSFYTEIEQRLNDFLLFEKLLDSNDIIFKFHPNKSGFSGINADYLMKTIYDFRTNYIFLKNYDNSDSKYCNSFFFNNSNDYTRNQITMTVLYKEKIDLTTGKSIVQLDRLKPRQNTQ